MKLENQLIAVRKKIQKHYHKDHFVKIKDILINNPKFTKSISWLSSRSLYEKITIVFSSAKFRSSVYFVINRSFLNLLKGCGPTMDPCGTCKSRICILCTLLMLQIVFDASSKDIKK